VAGKDLNSRLVAASGPSFRGRRGRDKYIQKGMASPVVFEKLRSEHDLEFESIQNLGPPTAADSEQHEERLIVLPYELLGTDWGQV
jgi:hypothetical protein